jgi:hypothetical protein
MTSPIRPLPEEVNRWISRAAGLRWCDAVVAWLALSALAFWLLDLTAIAAAALALALVGLASLIRPVRTPWRPISGCVGLAVSRSLKPGDRAWYVRSEHADPVLVTARHGTRLVIATPDLDEPDEVLTVRRTRVLLLPAQDTRLS